MLFVSQTSIIIIIIIRCPSALFLSRANVIILCEPRMSKNLLDVEPLFLFSEELRRMTHPSDPTPWIKSTHFGLKDAGKTSSLFRMFSWILSVSRSPKGVLPVQSSYVRTPKHHKSAYEGTFPAVLYFELVGISSSHFWRHIRGRSTHRGSLLVSFVNCPAKVTEFWLKLEEIGG